MTIESEQIAEWRAKRAGSMKCSIENFSPPEFWQALDEIEQLQAVAAQLRKAVQVGVAEINRIDPYCLHSNATTLNYLDKVLRETDG